MLFFLLQVDHQSWPIFYIRLSGQTIYLPPVDQQNTPFAFEKWPLDQTTSGIKTMRQREVGTRWYSVGIVSHLESGTYFTQNLQEVVENLVFFCSTWPSTQAYWRTFPPGIAFRQKKGLETNLRFLKSCLNIGLLELFIYKTE